MDNVIFSKFLGLLDSDAVSDLDVVLFFNKFSSSDGKSIRAGIYYQMQRQRRMTKSQAFVQAMAKILDTWQ